MDLTKEYDRERAVAYALRWSIGRNPLFYNFTGIGGDCTNFASQCVLAGSCVMNFTPTFGWYYRSVEDRAPAWTGVEFFWNFMTGVPAFVESNGGLGPFGHEVTVRETDVGDIVQLGDEEGSFYHTLIITRFEGGEPLLTSHSNDVQNRPLSSYDYSMVRFLHIDGVHLSLDAPDCFMGLVDGINLPF